MWSWFIFEVPDVTSNDSVPHKKPNPNQFYESFVAVMIAAPQELIGGELDVAALLLWAESYFSF